MTSWGSPKLSPRRVLDGSWRSFSKSYALRRARRRGDAGGGGRGRGWSERRRWTTAGKKAGAPRPSPPPPPPLRPPRPSHERLHSGPWHAVPSAWRDAYTLACLLQARERERKGEGTGTTRRGARRMRQLRPGAAAGRAPLPARRPTPPPPRSPPCPPLPRGVLLPPLSRKLGPPQRHPSSCPRGRWEDPKLGRGVETLSPRRRRRGAGAPPSLEDFVSKRPPARPPVGRCFSRVSSSWPASAGGPPRATGTASPEQGPSPSRSGRATWRKGWSQELRRCGRSSRPTSSSVLAGLAASFLAAAALPRRRDTSRSTTSWSRSRRSRGDVLTPDYALALSRSCRPAGRRRRRRAARRRGGRGVASNLWLGPRGPLPAAHGPQAKPSLPGLWQEIRPALPPRGELGGAAAGGEGEGGRGRR